ncbi:MAG: hypothetical protein COU47_03225 [Candidatus Niyogibacteria bacterium CG10_big_fil_rev_8_21_14_0_10_46_36]|uniref:Uncharacterized protein n=1 Tax=Candidatus Niyogibacteria bacterium CG10_big_fil_rev_8_21_14_0_10_46_36 TaxID=1974726 RepID=A0A2H0TEV6_9BACT|nr:MAG: hypothetical protein COU47_03225 [Candidatus Niyogibacteria bacterium CG10_big_fil_rev_8_21_14_0_10_46_36]
MKIFKKHTFEWWEVSFLKIGLGSLGVLLGLYFREALMSVMWLWWAILIVTVFYFGGRMLKE